MDRAILHLDMDAFFAAVEQRDRPELQDSPVIVGGSVNRGVVCACSYEARRFGVHSAMPMAQALRKCPAAVVLPVRKDRYQKVSSQVFSIFERYTDCIEPLSIDEAFLDVTGSRRLFGPALQIAKRIKKDVLQETGLVVSAGIAPNKFLAKLASDSDKPDGLVEVRPEDIDRFLLPLSVRRIWGIGKVSGDRLERLGVRIVADLRGLTREDLSRLFGKNGDHLYDLARGKDSRPVVTGNTIKSIGHEETYAKDLIGGESIAKELLHLAEKVAARLRKKALCGTCITVKVRYSDWSSVTRSCTVDEGMDHGGDLFSLGKKLLQKTEAGNRPTRLLGLYVSELKTRNFGQQSLFEHDDRQRKRSLDQAVDVLRERFGSDSVRCASLLQGENGKHKD